MLLKLVLPILLLSSIGTEGKKKKVKKTLFDSKTLNCLVCRWFFGKMVECWILFLKVFLVTDFHSLYEVQVTGRGDWGNDIQGRENTGNCTFSLAVHSQVDPKKKVETGSFRISGDGSQEGRKLVSLLRWSSRLIFQFARSHTRDPMSTCRK